MLNIQGGVSLKRQRSGRSPDASVCWIHLSVLEVLREGQDGETDRTGQDKKEKARAGGERRRGEGVTDREEKNKMKGEKAKALFPHGDEDDASPPLFKILKIPLIFYSFSLTYSKISLQTASSYC